MYRIVSNKEYQEIDTNFYYEVDRAKHYIELMFYNYEKRTAKDKAHIDAISDFMVKHMDTKYVFDLQYSVDGKEFISLTSFPSYKADYRYHIVPRIETDKPELGKIMAIIHFKYAEVIN